MKYRVLYVTNDSPQASASDLGVPQPTADWSMPTVVVAQACAYSRLSTGCTQAMV